VGKGHNAVHHDAKLGNRSEWCSGGIVMHDSGDVGTRYDCENGSSEPNRSVNSRMACSRLALALQKRLLTRASIRFSSQLGYPGGTLLQIEPKVREPTPDGTARCAARMVISQIAAVSWVRAVLGSQFVGSDARAPITPRVAGLTVILHTAQPATVTDVTSVG
jgi:hypothetical protein